MPNDLRRRIALITFGTTMAALAALPVLIHWSELPEPIASHWNRAGNVNGALPKSTLLLLEGIFAVLATLPAWLPTTKLRGALFHLSLAGGAFMGAFFALINRQIVQANLGHASWREASSISIDGLLWACALPLALSAGIWFLSTRLWPEPLTHDTPCDTLIALSDRQAWHGSAQNRGLLTLAGALTLSGALFIWLVPPGPSRVVLFGVHLVALFAAEALWRVQVVIDAHGVQICYGSFGWLRQRIPLDRVKAVSRVDVDPMNWGGWGYRGSLLLMRRAAVVVRAGDALRIELDGKKQLTVTVDDAYSGASVLHTLVQHHALLRHTLRAV